MPPLSPVYLDYNATTPVDPRVLEQMLPFFNERFGNAASRSHRFGWEADEAVETAREQVAHLIGAKPKEIFFTSGATESNNLALKGVAETSSVAKRQIISCATEHKAILDPLNEIETKGIDSRILTVNSEGILNYDELKSNLNAQTILVSLMLANNETGVIQEVGKISEACKKQETLLMTDAAQAIGKIPVDVNELGVDLMSFSGHKMYAPKGVGVLYIKGSAEVNIKSQQDGGGHERGVRSGTLNVPGIVGLGIACELCSDGMGKEMERIASLRDKLEDGLRSISGTSINGSAKSRLPHVTNVSFEGLTGEQLTLALNDVAVSHGSACTSATMEPSHVLKAMGLSDELAMSSLRFSLGRFTTEQEVEFALKRVNEVVRALRK